MTTDTKIKIKLNNIGLKEAKEIKEKEKIAKFHLLPKYKQGSKEWHDQRHNYLTASTISAALGLKGKAARTELLHNKASFGETNSFSGNHATLHGNKMEPVANAIYSFRNNVSVHEFGMITNEKYPILGVSPDGILLDRMLEIKCPYSRIIDGKIKTEYYHQMQEQMVVCDYKKCDFLECKFDILTEIEFWNIFPFISDKGSIISFIDEEGYVKYLYSELNQEMEELKKWIENAIDKYLVLNIFFWKLSVYNCQEVLRDDNWIINNYPILETFWNEVLELRKNGFKEEKSLDLEIEMEKLSLNTCQSKLPCFV